MPVTITAPLRSTLALLAASAALTILPNQAGAQPETAPPVGRQQLTSSWRVDHPGRLAVIRVAADGRPIAALSTPRRARLDVTDRLRVSTTQPAARYRIHVRVSSRRALRGLLVVQTHEPGHATVTRSRRVALGRGAWRHEQFESRRLGPGAAFTVTLRLPSLERRERVLIKDVALVRLPGPTHPAKDEPPVGELSNGCPYNQRGIPACGTLFGAAYQANTDPSPWEGEMGQQLTVRRTYWNGSNVDSAVRAARTDLANGRLPWISFKLPYAWADMAAGKGDAWAVDLAAKLAALPGPVWVAFHHEPENDGAITDWTAMQEHLAPLVRAEAPNVAYTIILTGWNQLYGPDQFSLEAIWPRQTTIDIAGFDVYNFYGQVSGGVTNTHMADMRAEYFDRLSSWAEAKGIPWAVAETGFSDVAAAVDPGWLQRSYDQMVETGGIAMVYFNSSLNSTTTWPLVASEKKSLFTEVLSDSPSFE